MNARFAAAALFALLSAAPALAKDEPKAAPKSDKAADQPASTESAAPAAEVAVSSAPFETAWKDATMDEKAAFLEASPELVSKVKDKWNKSTSKQKKLALAKVPLLAGRALKHKWDEATPEEKIAFLGSMPDVKKRVKETWDLLNADQRLQLVRKHPSYSRRALHHAWAEATSEEKIAFLESQGDLKRSLGKLWSVASGSEHKALEDASPEEATSFVDRLSALENGARERWQSVTPGLRAQLVRRWSGWKLKPSLIGLSMGGGGEARKKPAKKAVKKHKDEDSE